MTVRVGLVEWPDGLDPRSGAWSGIAGQVGRANLDLLATNELPFGRWIARTDRYDEAAAERFVEAGLRGLDALARIDTGSVISSTPVMQGSRLANEAVLVNGASARGFHRKQRFPEVEGWFEATWFRRGSDDYPLAEAAGLKIGTLLCTEAMFTELARSYGERGATLIVIPRASRPSHIWQVAARMTAIVSGCYVVSSNRCGGGADGPVFAGRGFAFGPEGEPLAVTTADEPLAWIDVDADRVAELRNLQACRVS